MRKALIGAAKISAVLGALALVLAFLGFYVMPALAAMGAGNGPIFSFNATSNSTYQFQPASNYGFQINITNETGSYGSIGNVTFELGRPNGLKTNYTNYTLVSLGVMVQNYTNLSFINFTQEQIGPAGTYNFTWYANDTTPTSGKWNSSQTVAFAIAQNTTPINITLYLNNVSSAITYPRGTVPLNITAQTNVSGPILNLYSNSALLNSTNQTNRNEYSLSLTALNFGVYNITANLTGASGTANYSSLFTQSFNFTLNSSTINFILNLTYVNASGYVNPITSLPPQAGGFYAQTAFAVSDTNCQQNNMTVIFTQQMGGIAATIPMNNTCNYTATVTMTDFISPTNQIFNSTLVIGNLNMTSGGNPISADIQLVPLGTYGKNSPSLKSILGGFAFNDSNILGTSSYQNASFAIARRGFMPDGYYRCSAWNQSVVGLNLVNCSGTWTSAPPLTDSGASNTTYLNKTLATQGGPLFYGYSEPFYNLRPLVKAYGGVANIGNITIANWGNQRTKYFSWVPMVKYNMTSRQAYLPASDAYSDAMYYDVPFFANPSAIEMLAYNFTINVSFASNSEVNISITPRVIRDNNGNVLSGNETALMPAWSVPDIQNFEGANVTRTILRPTFNTLYYSYNGTNCGPYTSTTPIVPGSNPRAVFTNTSMASPCNQTVSYDYSTNEMNLTLVNATPGANTLSVLFALAGRPTTGMYSPVYLVNQTFLGGFIPGPGQTPPSPGTASTISFMVKVNNSLSNFTTSTGTDAFIHFLYPKNVTVWQNSSNSTVNITANMGSGFQLWELNNTISAETGGPVNASATGDVATNGYWMMIANETHLWNASVSAYNTSLPNQQNFLVNRTFSCNNMTESFPGSPSNGKNLTICFQEFDFNLTSINSWLPGDARSNVTLNLTASLNVSILNEIKSATGTAGSTNQYNASISTASAGEVKLGETQVPGFNAATCGSDFSNCSKTVIVDGSALNSSSYRTGSIILNLASGTHAVSVTYTVPAAAAAAATTTASSGSSSTTVSNAVTGKLTKIFTSISPNVPRTIYEADLNGTDTGLKQITINVNNLAANVKISVEKLAGQPASITQQAVSGNGNVYKFMNISKENLADKDVANAIIDFKVEKSWLSANNFSALNVVLKRYTTQWDSLNTTMTSNDNTYYYYESITPGFSVFAVAADKGVATPAQPQQPAQPAVPKQPQQPAAQQPSAPQYDMTAAYTLVAAVVIIAGLLYFMEMRKKKSGKRKSEK